MNIKQCLLIAAIVLPATTFAASTDPNCSAKPADQKFWVKQYNALVAHGTAALAAHDTTEAVRVFEIADITRMNTCLKAPSPRYKKFDTELHKELHSVFISKLLADAKKMIDQAEYHEAFILLQIVLKFTETKNITMPDSYTDIRNRAAQSALKSDFEQLDAQQKSGQQNEAFITRERALCTEGVKYYGLPAPERCVKYQNEATKEAPKE